MEARIKGGGVLKNRFGRVRWGWLVIGAYLASSWILSGVFSMQVDALRFVFTRTGDISADGLTLSPLVDYLNDTLFPIEQQMLFELLIVAVVAAFWIGFLRKPWRQLGFPRQEAGRSLRLFGLGAAVGLIAIALVFGAISLFGDVRMDAPLTLTPEWLAWLVAFAFVALGEEVMYRGFVMGVLRRDHGELYAVIASAIVFALVHGMNPNVTPLGFVNIFLVGVALALLYLKTGSLWLTTGFHFMWNALQGVVLGSAVSGLDIPSVLSFSAQGSDLVTGGLFGLEGSLFTTVASLAGVAIVLLGAKRTGRRKEDAPIGDVG